MVWVHEDYNWWHVTQLLKHLKVQHTDVFSHKRIFSFVDVK